MQVQIFEPTARTLRDFQDFCKRLESALDDPPVDNKSNKTSGQEKGNKERHQNNHSNKDKKHFCMLHGHNPTHSTEQCRTLKKEAKKHKKGRENGDWKNTKHTYNPSKDEIHMLAAFTKEAMAKEYKNVNKELENFKNMSMSSKKADE